MFPKARSSTLTAASKALLRAPGRHGIDLRRKARSRLPAMDFRQPSKGLAGLFGRSFCSGIASYPRKFVPDGPADRLADRTSAGDHRETLHKFAVCSLAEKRSRS